MSQKLVQDEETLAEVNVIPLADVSLVLLIVLMVISPLISQALIQVTSAKAQAAESQADLATPETPIVVSFEPGALMLNGIKMGSELEFVTRLSQLLGSRHDKGVILTASPQLTEGKVVHVMDLIKRHGCSTLTMLKWAVAGELASAPAPGKARS